MATSPFFLAPPSTSGKQVDYKVHPLVVFSILDHYRRREPQQHRVVGTLLGEVLKTPEGSVIHIKNCYPIPHSETNDQISIDTDYHKNMAALQKRLHPKESVVGWYSTGKEISYTSSLIHEVFARRMKKNPIHLVVDATLSHSQLAVKGFIGRNIRVEGKDIVAQFEEVKVDFHTTEAAKIAVDAMINGVPEDSKELDAPATMLSELENLEHSLQELLHLLETVSDYVDGVNKGEIKGTQEVGSAIRDALASIPRVDPEMFTRMFNQKTEDLLMIFYLGNITRAQVALGNRIYEVLD